MPSDQQISHRVVRNASLPYVSNLSPTATDPCFIPGSTDLLTSINGYAQRRPGFAATPEATPTVFNNVQRTFTWNRTDGTFFLMICDVNSSGFAQVFKFQFGADTSASSIFTDTVATPFDFTFSNNVVYFSNGNVAKVWDPVNGVRNWGIAIGSVNNATGPNRAGNGANSGPGTNWTNPNNVTSTVSYADVTLGSSSASAYDQATQFAFAIPANTTIKGIQVTVEQFANSTAGAPVLLAQLLKAGVGTGDIKSVPFSGSSATATFGGSSDLWNASWTSNDTDQTNFGVQLQAFTHNAATFHIRNVQITIFGLGGPAISVSGSAGTFSATQGYEYVFTYGNSTSGHISSPTPVSASTGVFANKLNVQVSLTASTDPQVNQIHVYRSTDSAPAGTTAATFFELPNSPFPNTTANITDNAPDTSLIVASIAPTPTFNDPPTPGQCAVYFAGRIWMFTGTYVWFSSLEECIAGVPEESWPSGFAGNFWRFDQPVQALAVAGSGSDQTLIIYCGGRVYGITGNSLDTFRRFVISNSRGCRNIKAVASMGGMVAWRDTSGQVWATDGSNMQELSVPIRPDLTPYTPGADSMSFFAMGAFHWLLVSTGTQIFVYDLDTEQWMPPWSHTTNQLHAGESAPGSYQLFSCDSNTEVVTQLVATGSNFDLGAAQTHTFYTPTVKLSFVAAVPDFGTRFSSAMVGFYDEPSRSGMPWYFQIDNDGSTISDVLRMVDDDPLNPATTYTSIAANKTSSATAWNRNSGTRLVQNVYSDTRPVCRWISWQFTGTAANDNFKTYGWFTAYSAK